MKALIIVIVFLCSFVIGILFLNAVARQGYKTALCDYQTVIEIGSNGRVDLDELCK